MIWLWKDKNDHAQPFEKLGITMQKSQSKIKEFRDEKEKQGGPCGWKLGNDRVTWMVITKL